MGGYISIKMLTCGAIYHMKMAMYPKNKLFKGQEHKYLTFEECDHKVHLFKELYTK